MAHSETQKETLLEEKTAKKVKNIFLAHFLAKLNDFGKKRG
jgi:hypothetical protein